MKPVITLIFLLLAVACLAQKATVQRVIDGDTYVIETGERVRMIGINAPEMKTEQGPAAKLHLKQLIEGKEVNLIKDETGKQKDKDKYGRLLRYTELNGADINQLMVCNGFAIVYTRFGFGKSAEYKKCQQQAKQNRLGIWGGSNSNDTVAEQKAEISTGQNAATEETTAKATGSQQETQFTDNTFFYVCMVILALLLSLLGFKVRRK